MFVVRWALDDAVDNSLASAVDALHALIVCTEDEVRTMPVLTFCNHCKATLIFTWSVIGSVGALALLLGR